MKHTLDKIRSYCAIHGCGITFLYACGLIFEKLGCAVSAIYMYQNERAHIPQIEAQSYEIVDSVSQFSNEDVSALITYQGMGVVHAFQGLFEQGYRCAIGRFQKQLGCICWVHSFTHRALRGENNFLISQCFTLPHMRGKGLYPATLVFLAEYARREYAQDAHIIIGSSVCNRASLKGIQKAGFKKVTTEIKVCKATFYFPLK